MSAFRADLPFGAQPQGDGATLPAAALLEQLPVALLCDCTP